MVLNFLLPSAHGSLNSHCWAIHLTACSLRQAHRFGINVSFANREQNVTFAGGYVW